MADTIKTQNDQLLRELQKGPITALQALDRLGIARCAARVWDLRQDGWNIESKRVDVINRNREQVSVAQYSLVEHERSILPVELGRGRMTA